MQRRKTYRSFIILYPNLFLIGILCVLAFSREMVIAPYKYKLSFLPAHPVR